MRRVIGIDIHRAFGEVVFWEGGKLRCAGRIDMTRTALEGFGKSLLATDEVVIEATGNCMSVSRVLTPFVKRVVIANPLQVRAIAHAHVNTDKVGAGTLATRRVICPRYGPRTRLPNGCDGWSPGATRSCGPGRGSTTRCTRSCTHHLIPRCSHAISSTSVAGTGWRANPCRMTSRPRSSGMCANSIGSARISPFSTARSRRAHWTSSDQAVDHDHRRRSGSGGRTDGCNR